MAEILKNKVLIESNQTLSFILLYSCYLLKAMKKKKDFEARIILWHKWINLYSLFLDPESEANISEFGHGHGRLIAKFFFQVFFHDIL